MRGGCGLGGVGGVTGGVFAAVATSPQRCSWVSPCNGSGVGWSCDGAAAGAVASLSHRGDSGDRGDDGILVEAAVS